MWRRIIIIISTLSISHLKEVHKFVLYHTVVQNLKLYLYAMSFSLLTTKLNISAPFIILSPHYFLNLLTMFFVFCFFSVINADICSKFYQLNNPTSRLSFLLFSNLTP